MGTIVAGGLLAPHLCAPKLVEMGSKLIVKVAMMGIMMGMVVQLDVEA